MYAGIHSYMYQGGLYASYKGWKHKWACEIGVSQAVYMLPIRDGNGKIPLGRVEGFLVYMLPIRDGN